MQSIFQTFQLLDEISSGDCLIGGDLSSTNAARDHIFVEDVRVDVVLGIDFGEDGDESMSFGII